MNFALNFSQLNYIYTISHAVHLRIVNVDVPLLMLGLTPPSACSPTTPTISKLRGPAEETALTPRRAAVGRSSGVPGGFAGCRPSQSSFPRIKQRNRLPETGRFHLGLKFRFQVQVLGGGSGLSSRGIKALVIHLDPLGSDAQACLT